MDTSPRTRISRFGTAVLAAAIGCALLVAAPATSAAAPSQSGPPAHVKIEAKADKLKVKANGKVKVNGKFKVAKAARADGGSPLATVYLQQRLSTGVWVDLDSSRCRPNGTFGFHLNVSTSLTLRVHHPGTTVYAAASSELFTVLVI